MNIASHLNDVVSMHYSHPKVIRRLSDHIILHLPRKITHVIVICIGTDRSTGDSLGPLTGTYTKRHDLKHLKVYGSLHYPVHAKNLNDYLTYIKQKYKGPFIIAIDASLGKQQSIGKLMNGNGPLKPGAALQKMLPDVGHYFMTGVVNIYSNHNFTTLQSTRLSLIHDMAYKLSLILHKVDQWIAYYLQNKLIHMEKRLS